MSLLVTCLAHALLVLAIMWPAPAAAQTYDIIIRNGRVLDGTGNPWYRADVAIAGDRIVAVGRLPNATARKELDARGLYVTPGFIDVHSHATPGLASPELSEGRPLLTQGLTTIFANPDGGGPVNLAEQRDALLRDGLGPNVAQLVPHGAIRAEVIGMEDRAPTPRELDRMRDLVRAGMEAGAVGFSSGPYYAPGSYSTTEELVELAKIAAEYGGIYTSHIRDEADYTVGVVAAVDEVIRISREADIRGVVTHMKALGPRVWGFSTALVHRIRQARDEGLEVFADQYPYEASGTGITGALVPRWALVGGQAKLLERINNPPDRARLRADMLENLDRRGGPERLQFQRHVADPSIEGRTVAAVAQERGKDVVDFLMELLVAGGAGLVSFNMHPEDIATLMRQPWMMTSSDGGLIAMNQGVPHPRYYGAFPRKIRKYVKEDGVIDLPTAIRSMTSLPASVFRMDDRGVIRPGAIADVVVFDLAQVQDLADYQNPHQLSEGMVHVLVNGQPAIEDGRFTNARSGRVLSQPRVVHP